MTLERILLEIIFFLIVFFIIFLVDFYILSKSKDKNKKRRVEKLTSQGMYLTSRFNLDDKKINLKKLNFHIAIINAFIIAFVSTVINIIKVPIGFQLAIGFVLIFALIYSIYEIYGRHLKKIWGKTKKED